MHLQSQLYKISKTHLRKVYLTYSRPTFLNELYFETDLSKRPAAHNINAVCVCKLL